jgi:hypothetical protein
MTSVPTATQVRAPSSRPVRSGPTSGRKRRRARGRAPRVPELGELLRSAEQPGSPPAFDFAQLRIHDDAEEGDQRDTEQLDPATLGIRMATDVLRSLRGDPEDRSHRVQLQLARIEDPDLSSAVMAKLQVWLPSTEYTRVTSLVAEANASASPLATQSQLSPEPVQEPDPLGDQVARDDAAVSDATSHAQLQAERKPRDAQTRAEKATASAEHQQPDVLAAALRTRPPQPTAPPVQPRVQPQQTARPSATPPPMAGSVTVPSRPAVPTGGGSAAPTISASDDTPPIAIDQVDAQLNAPDGPLARHQLEDTPGDTAERQPDQAPPGEEPIGAENTDLPDIDVPEPALPDPESVAARAEPAAGRESPSARPRTTGPAPEPVPLEDAATEPEGQVAAKQTQGRAGGTSAEQRGEELRGVPRDVAMSLEGAAQADLPSQSSSDAPESLDLESLTSESAPALAAGSGVGLTGSEVDTDEAGRRADIAPDSGSRDDAAAAGAPEALPPDASIEPVGGSSADGPESSADAGSEGGGAAGTPAGGGGSAAPPPQPAIPDVSQQQPTAALAVVGALPAVQLARGLSGVNAAVGHSVTQQRAALAKSPPQLQRPSGAPQTMRGLPLVAPPASYGSEKVQKATAREAGQQAKPQGKQVTGGPTPADQVPAPKLTGNAKGDATSTDVENVQQSVNNVPTTDPVLDHATVGVAPKVQLTGQADLALTDTQLTNLRDRAAGILTIGRDDANRPLGENEIYPEMPAHEMLKATIPGGGAAAPVAASVAVNSGPAGDQAVSAIAQQEHGSQIQSAVAQGESQLDAGQQARQRQEAQDRQQHRAKVNAAIKKSTDDETAERGKVAVQARQQRQAWQDQENKLTSDADTEAGSKHDKARADIEKKKSATDTQIDKHQQTGNAQIAAKRKEAQAKARAEQAKKQSQSGGWFGWVCSKISDAFHDLISAVKGIFDEARKFVQGVIDTFKKLATSLINAARKWIIDQISALATVLLAIGSALLVAFPALRDKFRKLIISLRNDAIALVNKIANFLKKAITDLLNLLGKALSALLDYLEKQLLAAVKSVESRIQSVINFVKNAIAILGQFAQIVRDVAADPGGWIKKLGSAIVDGIRYYLWDAIKTAVKNWFTGQIQQILGLGQVLQGGMHLLDVLRRGAITIGKIVQMAWQAMISAIPQLLIQLVIQKLIAFLVPAVGGIIQIVQGVIAAYNTISSIITAISRFVAFLKEVRSGAAARPFALAVAAGAVALINFVANWLLSKLKDAAKGIGSKLKGIAEKILAFLRRGAQTVRKGIGTVFNLAKRGAKAAVSAIKRAARAVVRFAKRVAARLPSFVRRGLRLVANGIRALGRRLANTRLGKFLINLARKLRAKYLEFKAKLAEWRNKIRKWLDDRKKKEEEPEGKEEQPTVDAPFEMALFPHTLVLSSIEGDVEVGARSAYEPLRARYAEVYDRIEYYKAYVNSIEDTAVKESFQNELMDNIEGLQTTSVAAYKEAYTEAFPERGDEEKEMSAETEAALTEKIEGLTAELEEMLSSVVEWGNSTGVTDLSGDAVDEVFDVKGPEIWNARFEQIQGVINGIVSDTEYQGQRVGLVGSVVTGRRGRYKGRVRLNLDDFDVDMYVVDPEEFDRVLPLVAGTALVKAEGSVIMPDAEHTPDLLALSRQVDAELADELEKLGVGNLDRISGSDPSLIALRRTPPY